MLKEMKNCINIIKYKDKTKCLRCETQFSRFFLHLLTENGLANYDINSGSKVKFVRLDSCSFGLVQWRLVSGKGEFIECTGDSRGQSWKSDYL